MAIGAISLTLGMRNSLNSLNDLQGMIDKTNKRLATGKKVNDILDGPGVFFQAQGFNRSAKNLSESLDAQGLGAKAVEKAVKTTNSAASLLQTAQGLARQALTTAAGAGRDALLAQAAQILTATTGQFDLLTADGGFEGKNLLRTGATNDQKVTFDPSTGSSLTITAADLKIGGGVTITAAGYAAGATDAAVNTLIGELTTGIAAVQSRGSALAGSLNIINVRQQFTKDSSNILNAAADGLTAADINEEGANLTSLQTRQQLSVTAMSLASRSDQAILRLF